MASRKKRRKRKTTLAERAVEQVTGESSLLHSSPLTSRPFEILKHAVTGGARRQTGDNNPGTSSTDSMGITGSSERVKAQESQKPRKMEGSSRAPCASPSSQSRKGEDEEELRLFLQAMEGVQPIEHGRGYSEDSNKEMGNPSQDTKASVAEEDAAIRILKELVSGRAGLPVEKTPEYVHGPDINDNPQIVRKLRRGKYAIQAYCDLHGLTAAQAEEVCNEFMEESIQENRRCIAYIHGRGLSSKREPVLKKVVLNFLTKGAFRRWVLAYSSAPSWDGGAGVTYVLLRKRPARVKRA